MSKKPKQHNHKLVKKQYRWPARIFWFSVIAVILSFLLYYLIDLRNLFGLRDLLFSTSPVYFYFPYQPFFFQHWGGSIVELFQWFFLGASALLAMYFVGRMHDKNKPMARFWLLLAITFGLMLLEDTGDVRHVIMGYVQALFDEPDQGVAGTITELLYFGALAAIPTYAIIKYWNPLKDYARTKSYILIGFVAYAIAQFLSFIGTAFDMLLDRNLYVVMGEWFYEASLRVADPEVRGMWEHWQETQWFSSIPFTLMDSLVEENIELIGAAAFLAATVAFYIHSQKPQEKQSKPPHKKQKTTKRSG